MLRKNKSRKAKNGQAAGEGGQDTASGLSKEDLPIGKRTDLTKDEFDRLIARIETNHKIRNDILTFSFTVVIAALGIGFKIESVDLLTSFLFLLPFFIIIPFQSRLTYYRMEEAHVRAYFFVYRPEWQTYSIRCRGKYGVGEDKGFGKKAYGRNTYGAIAWLMNHEMVILAFATAGAFYLRYSPFVTCDWITWLPLVIPVFLTAIVWWFAAATCDYAKVFYHYAEEWEARKKAEDNLFGDEPEKQ